ncbi:MAG TPA: 6-carboxytetrahydropterin synthase [Acidobacteriaceae bacterium]|jgi:6-pyruvoyltetrahydropterin/6-carboxytetrahydropterin synthase|nr:6-carboxytetrahydropterin synthase [Acidobacteriaceae bacterium]
MAELSQQEKQSAGPMVYLSRRYRLSASHRLHTEAYSEEENRDVYGKCNNPHGHGHNYGIEVTVGGSVNARTGMVCDLSELDGFAKINLLQRFDKRNLNTLDEFGQTVPTTENLTREVYRIFQGFRGARVVRIRIQETTNNSFEYGEALRKD